MQFTVAGSFNATAEIAHSGEAAPARGAAGGGPARGSTRPSFLRRTRRAASHACFLSGNSPSLLTATVPQACSWA